MFLLSKYVTVVEQRGLDPRPVILLLNSGKLVKPSGESGPQKPLSYFGVSELHVGVKEQAVESGLVVHPDFEKLLKDGGGPPRYKVWLRALGIAEAAQRFRWRVGRDGTIEAAEAGAEGRVLLLVEVLKSDKFLEDLFVRLRPLLSSSSSSSGAGTPGATLARSSSTGGRVEFTMEGEFGLRAVLQTLVLQPCCVLKQLCVDTETSQVVVEEDLPAYLKPAKEFLRPATRIVVPAVAAAKPVVVAAPPPPPKAKAVPQRPPGKCARWPACKSNLAPRCKNQACGACCDCREHGHRGKGGKPFVPLLQSSGAPEPQAASRSDSARKEFLDQLVEAALAAVVGFSDAVDAWPESVRCFNTGPSSSAVVESARAKLKEKLDKLSMNALKTSPSNKDWALAEYESIKTQMKEVEVRFARAVQARRVGHFAAISAAAASSSAAGARGRSPADAAASSSRAANPSADRLSTLYFQHRLSGDETGFEMDFYKKVAECLAQFLRKQHFFAEQNPQQNDMIPALRDNVFMLLWVGVTKRAERTNEASSGIPRGAAAGGPSSGIPSALGGAAPARSTGPGVSQLFPFPRNTIGPPAVSGTTDHSLTPQRCAALAAMYREEVRAALSAGRHAAVVRNALDAVVHLVLSWYPEGESAASTLSPSLQDVDVVALWRRGDPSRSREAGGAGGQSSATPSSAGAADAVASSTENVLAEIQRAGQRFRNSTHEEVGGEQAQRIAACVGSVFGASAGLLSGLGGGKK